MEKVLQVLSTLLWPIPWLVENLRAFKDIRKVDGEWEMPPFSSHSPIVDIILIAVILFLTNTFINIEETWVARLFITGLYIIGGMFQYKYLQEDELKGKEKRNIGNSSWFPYSAGQATCLAFIIFLFSR